MNLVSESDRVLEPISMEHYPLDSLKGVKILLVEDNLLNQELAMDILSDYQAQVTIADNGKTGVEKVANESFDIVLMDMQMPVMDGIEATKVIRKDYDQEALPILALTANAMLDDVNYCKSIGMNDHVAKPIDIDELLAKIIQWTSNRHQEQESMPQARAKLIDTNTAELNNTTTAVLEVTHEPPKQEANEGFFGIMDDLAELSVINVTPLKARFKHNETLIGRLITRFYSQKSTLFDELIQSYQEGAFDLLALHAHTLKGVAAMVGAENLSDAAQTIEEMIKKEADLADIEVHLDALKVEFTACLSQLEPIVKKYQQPSVQIDHTALKGPIHVLTLEEQAQLENRIMTGDSQSAQLIRELLARNVVDGQQTVLNKMLDAVQSYDFDRAESLIEQLDQFR